jgi:hypothetical protein
MRNFLLLILLVLSFTGFAQVDLGKYGSISGSFETNNQLYVKDILTNAVFPQDRIGSNNYLKVDYRLQKFSAGIQYEAYLPSLQGYPFVLNESKLVQKYFSYQETKFGFTIGNFYEQFGSGLIFRSWENRQLGINNAIEGVNIHLKPINSLDFKFIYGKQRRSFENSDGTIRAIDANWHLVNPSQTNKEKTFSMGASFVSRYQQYTGPDPDFKPTVNAFSGRLNYADNNNTFSAEYVVKSKDPHVANQQNTNNGKGLLVNYGLTKNNVGFNLNLRRLENMDFRTDRNAGQSMVLVNYIPALTKQQEYYLSNIYVYNAQALGEIGGQADLYYTIPKNTKLGGKYGMNIILNYSRYHSLQITSQTPTSFESNFLGAGKQLFYGDINLAIKKKLSGKWTTNYLLQHIFYNKSVVEGGNYANIKSAILVADVLYKYAPKKSFRTELQHLFTRQDKKNWMGVLMEWSYAPHFSLFASDMYNYGISDKKTHYYNTGGSYTTGPHKLLLSYGRQRAGLVCVGGVCRLVPAATGLNISFTSNF